MKFDKMTAELGNRAKFAMTAIDKTVLREPVAGNIRKFTPQTASPVANINRALRSAPALKAS